MIFYQLKTKLCLFILFISLFFLCNKYLCLLYLAFTNKFHSFCSNYFREYLLNKKRISDELVLSKYYSKFAPPNNFLFGIEIPSQFKENIIN